MPALLTRTSIAPKAPRVSSTILFAKDSSPTSATIPSTSGFGTALRISASTECIWSASRSTSTMRAPSSQNSRPVAEPTPPAPPVTIATLPSSRPMISGRAGPQQVEEVHEPDRARVLDNDKRGDLRRFLHLEGLRDELVGRDRARRPGHDRGHRQRRQFGPQVPAQIAVGDDAGERAVLGDDD